MPKIGYKKTEEAKKKISESHKKIGAPWNTGTHRSKETKLKMSLKKLGKPSPIKGKKIKPHTIEHIEKIRLANSGKFRERSPNWQGGKSFEKYSTDWTNTFRISIRERDNYMCMVCGIKQGDKAHQIHHIDYNKQNCNPKNLITLCIRCHMRTNGNREYWIEYFTKKLDNYK